MSEVPLYQRSNLPTVKRGSPAASCRADMAHIRRPICWSWLASQSPENDFPSSLPKGSTHHSATECQQSVNGDIRGSSRSLKKLRTTAPKSILGILPRKHDESCNFVTSIPVHLERNVHCYEQESVRHCSNSPAHNTTHLADCPRQNRYGKSWCRSRDTDRRVALNTNPQTQTPYPKLQTLDP